MGKSRGFVKIFSKKEKIEKRLVFVGKGTNCFAVVLLLWLDLSLSSAAVEASIAACLGEKDFVGKSPVKLN